MQPSDTPITDKLDQLGELRVLEDLEITTNRLANPRHLQPLLLDGVCEHTLSCEQLEKRIDTKHCQIIAAATAAAGITLLPRVLLTLWKISLTMYTM